MMYMYHFFVFIAFLAAFQPVRIAVGIPAGLYAHCPAWYTLGIGVLTELGIFRSSCTTGTDDRYDQPTIAPSEVPAILAILNGVADV